MNKIIAGTVVGVVIVGSASFFGGMKYAQNNTAATFQGGNFSNLSAEERQERTQQLGENVGIVMQGNGTRGGSSFVTGEIISKDEQSITVKLQDGGSKIILFSESTKISENTVGSADDLKTGEQIVITGTANQDGSITAQTVQIGGASRVSTPPTQ
ncbi:MAG: hypothetical protein U1D31_03575 [Patescibacteria group bacterium]|nr:hypothetical protein [bacterium]MDZ4241172.1 hypothetical protein [Patescibacteria group bacterium]